MIHPNIEAKKTFFYRLPNFVYTKIYYIFVLKLYILNVKLNKIKKVNTFLSAGDYYFDQYPVFC